MCQRKCFAVLHWLLAYYTHGMGPRESKHQRFLSAPLSNSSVHPPRGLRLELALSQETDDSSSDSSNQRLVILKLYEALSSRDVDTVHTIVAPDLEWWFHGPPTHQFLMRLLTGDESDTSFEFNPQSITSVGPVVLVEGCDREQDISWVHAWTVTDGIVTQVREYFNTSLTVTRLGNSAAKSKFSKSSSEITSYHCPSVWESSNGVGKSVPGLVLAI
ncbi:hypothetical protein M0R45_037618 [Rubus argutus]|uniref:Wound-induced protein 1 n=1 Tax=Rubus argutus TaxID=59490 RepID=A0AAW1W4X6_RUBAR